MIIHRFTYICLISKQFNNIDLIGHRSDGRCHKKKTNINPIVNSQNSKAKKIDYMRKIKQINDNCHPTTPIGQIKLLSVQEISHLLVLLVHLVRFGI